MIFNKEEPPGSFLIYKFNIMFKKYLNEYFEYY